jgi:hypothetical protein
MPSKEIKMHPNQTILRKPQFLAVQETRTLNLRSGNNQNWKRLKGKEESLNEDSKLMPRDRIRPKKEQILS